MIVVTNEKYSLALYPRKENSAYEWEQNPSIVFKGRPAGQVEKKNYRIQQGVNGGTDSVFIISSNLPKDIKVADRIDFMGKRWTVMSVGFYFDESRFVNPNIMRDEYIANRCPKGINIE